MGEVIGYSILGIAAILIVAFSILSDKDEKERICMEEALLLSLLRFRRLCLFSKSDISRIEYKFYSEILCASESVQTFD